MYPYKVPYSIGKWVKWTKLALNRTFLNPEAFSTQAMFIAVLLHFSPLFFFFVLITLINSQSCGFLSKGARVSNDA
jgi:hypothetical protein